MDSVCYTIRELEYKPLSPEVILKFVGPPIQNSLMTYLGVDKDTAQKGANIFREYYKSKSLFKASLYPGIIELMEVLRHRDIKIGVATYKREDYALDILRHFGILKYCDVAHGADNENKLSKADIVELCIKELGEDKSNVILVGDTDHDAKGANDANVGFVAVIWGFGYKSVEEVIAYPCILRLSRPMDLTKLI